MTEGTPEQTGGGAEGSEGRLEGYIILMEGCRFKETVRKKGMCLRWKEVRQKSDEDK